MSAGTDNLIAKFHRNILSALLKNLQKYTRGYFFAAPCTTFIYHDVRRLHTWTHIFYDHSV